MMKFRKFLVGVAISLAFIPGLLAQNVTSPDITVKDLKSHISFLASDSLKGRYTGSPGNREAGEYIRDQFRDAGLKLLGENGFQNFEVVVSVHAGQGNSLEIGDYSAMEGTDYVPFPFSKNGTVNAGVVFAGYGFEIDQDSLAWDDYKGLDVKGKWVMILRGDPETERDDSPFALFGDDRDKVILARDKGAAGVLLVSGPGYDENDNLVSMYFDKTKSTVGLPVFHIKRYIADKMLATDHLDVDVLENRLITGMKPHSFALTAMVNGTTDVVQEKVIARNVVGMLEGSDPVLKNSYVVIGAHYDHLGTGGPGSGSRFIDSLAIHNGADDNASGVAGILELSAFLATQPATFKRSLVFIAFDGEELGLLGSGYFVNNPLIPIKDVDAMINFDMIGRLKEDTHSIMIGGTGTSLESVSILDSLKTGDIRLTYSPEGYGPSDHASFYSRDIPVFFFTTGAHEDYHMPSDDWDKINYDGEKEVIDIGRQLILTLADMDKKLTFQEAGPKDQAGGRASYRFKVTLGIMPDFTSSSENGLGVGGVRKGGPADKGGMLKGDIITAVDGKEVHDIYDYMNRLKTLKSGQIISVDVLRDNKKVVLIIKL